MGEIKGKDGLRMVYEESSRVQSALIKDAYEHYQFTVPGGGYSDHSLAAINPSAFQTVIRAHNVIIRTSADISFKFNATGNHPVSLTAAEGSFSINALEIDQIYFTAPAGAIVKVLLI